MTANELEALGLLVEECGEICQGVGKIIRHGIDNGWDGITNREYIEMEVADVIGVLKIIKGLDFLDWNSINSRLFGKFENGKINKYLHNFKVYPHWIREKI